MSPNYPKGDVRRLLSIVALIADNQPISILKLAELSAMPNGTVQQQLKKIKSGQLPGITLINERGVYSLKLTNEIFNLKLIQKWYLNECEDRLLKTIK